MPVIPQKLKLVGTTDFLKLVGDPGLLLLDRTVLPASTRKGSRRIHRGHARKQTRK